MQDNITNIPRLTLVGAAGNDPELITLKGINALKSADVVLYDALINKELLIYAPENSLTISVGKRANEHSKTQKEINDLILLHALQNKHVVRLKGGDPMVFGRASEEINCARENNILVEVVPGISTYATWAAQYQVPITKRNHSNGFWVMTGTTCTSEMAQDIQCAAQSTSTILIYMGLGRLYEIVETFLIHKPVDYPIGIFQNIGATDERYIIATLDTIIKINQTKKIQSPAMIVIGNALLDVESFRKSFKQ